MRGSDGRGRHTTSARQLLAVPGGGVLIDTPGLRSLALGGGVDIDQAFPDIEELATACRFGDCHHQVEPGCAVIAALASGTLDPARLASFRKLEREVAADARRGDPLLRKAELGVWKIRTKAARLAAKRKAR